MKTRPLALQPLAPSWILLGALWGLLIYVLAPQWLFFEDYHYGWSVPFLTAYLIWQRISARGNLENTRHVFRPPSFVLGLTVGLLALLLLPARIILEANSLWRAASWPIATAVVGITFCLLSLMGGWRLVKRLWFPICFFLVAVPWPGEVERRIIPRLSNLNAGATVELLTMGAGIPAIRRGAVIEISSGKVGIDEACSGVRSVQATLMIALFLGELYRLSSVRRIGLMAVGAALAFGCNIARTFFLTWTCAHDGMGALEKWHDSAGVAVVLGCFSGLWAVAAVLRGRKREGRRQNTEGRGRMTEDGTDVGHQTSGGPVVSWSAGLVPLPMAAIYGLGGWLLFVEAANEGWFCWHEARMKVQTVQWSVRLPEAERSFRTNALSALTWDLMEYDEGQSASWMDATGHPWQLFAFRWAPGTRASSAAIRHGPEVCLPLTGKKLNSVSPVKDVEVHGLPLPFRTYFFDDHGRPLHVFYCHWEDGIKPEARVNVMRNGVISSRLEAAWEGKRRIGKRTLELAVWGFGSEELAEEGLRALLPEIVKGGAEGRRTEDGGRRVG